jgi:hypothetical protein
MLKQFVIASFVSAGLAAPAAATPAMPKAPLHGIESNVIQVQNKHRKRHWNKHQRRHHWRGHRAGPPRGWHRYHSRPWDWQRRGCVMFGPVWFCP